jgi:hypothetical protein
MAPTDYQFVKNGLHEIADKAYALGMGLQNVSPPQAEGKSVNTIQYLLDTAMQLEQINRSLDAGRKDASSHD